MIAYIETRGFMCPVPYEGDVDKVLARFRDANPSEVKLLAVEDGGQTALDLFREGFKEFHHRDDWYFFVPTIQKFVKEVAGA